MEMQNVVSKWTGSTFTFLQLNQILVLF